MPIIVPAILSRNLKDFENKIQQISPICRHLQIDFMDGNFVKNTTIMPEEIINYQIPNLVEAHLMVNKPADYINRLQTNSSISTFIFHVEGQNISEILNFIPPSKAKGVAINPETPVKIIEPIINYIDLLLIMSVNPGAGGQEFLPVALDKIREARSLRDDLIIEVDGGIHQSEASLVANAGADRIVVGTGLFNTRNIEETLNNFRFEVGELT
jgi:ribulose-phosphate 3-epimerase